MARLTIIQKKILCWGLIVIAIICLILLINFLAKGKSTSDSGNKSCSNVVELERFDCFPEGSVSESKCKSRGCCYNPSPKNKGAPSCFFPPDYIGYSIHALNQSDMGYNASLKRRSSSGFLDDVQHVGLSITYIDDKSLRIKIFDLNADRFEPDVPLYYEIKERKSPLYNVAFDSKGILAIKRKSSGKEVFKTDLSKMIFSDQFLQLSTSTSSIYLYGLGEHQEGILKSFNWKLLTLFNQGDLPEPNRNLYGSHPFYLVMEDEGKANGVFWLNSNAIDAFLQPTPAITLRSIGGIFDLFVMLGTSPADVIQTYTGIIGRSFMPPYWSLGFHMCRYGYFTLNKTKEVLERNVEAGIPLDVQWHDIDYMDRYLDFTYDKTNFSGLPEFIKELHNNGMHYVAMISPGVSNTEIEGTYPPYDEALQQDLFIKDYKGKYIEAKVWNTNFTVFPDFSNPATPNYWIRQFERFYDEIKYDGIWIDMNEPLNFLNGSNVGCPESKWEDPQYLPGGVYPLRTLTLCMTAKHNVTLHYNEHNLLSFRESHATFDALKLIRKKRPFIISRATFAGQGIYSGHWSGDIDSIWEDMRYTIPFMINFNMYGISMIGSDICGFRLNTTEELCARWHSLGAFYPFSRNHNDFDTIDQDAAAMGDDVIKSAKDALFLRYYLLPYLYTLFYRSHVFGETVIRPLFFEFPKDKKTYSVDEQFLWGPALMIVPVLHKGKTDVEAYIPNGVWYNFVSKDQINSTGEKIVFPTNITEINLLVQGGYVLPLQRPNVTTTQSRKNHFDLFAALDKNKEAVGELYWDDGDSLDTYVNGHFNLIQFHVKNNTLKSEIIKQGYTDPENNMKLASIMICGIGNIPKNITINGANCTFESYRACISIDASTYTLIDPFEVIWD